MLVKTFLLGVLSFVAIADATGVDTHFHRAHRKRQTDLAKQRAGNGGAGNGGGAGNFVLPQDLVQTASNSNGNPNTTAGETTSRT